MENIAKESDQPVMESDQPQANSEEQPQEDSDLIDINGVKMTKEKLREDHIKLQKEFTKKSQALKGSQPQDTDDIEQAAQILKEHGFITQEQMKEELQYQSLASSNPNLKMKELKELAQLPSNKDKALEDIIHEYGLNGTDKLKVRSTKVVGGAVQPGAPEAPKGINEMSDAEYEEHRNSQLPENLR